MRHLSSLSVPALLSFAAGALASACAESDLPLECPLATSCRPISVADANVLAIPDEPPPADEDDIRADAGAPIIPAPVGPDAAPPPPREPTLAAKVDLLLVVDNSISMSDKQALLSRSLPALVERLVDVNVAVISSSLGDVGANEACPAGESDDRAHLIGSLPRGAGLGTNSAGVLELRPGDDVAEFTNDLGALVDAVGQNGCGWEMTLESMYRFLADPAPYDQLERVACTPGESRQDCVRPARDAQGQVIVDRSLLEQRAAFLRPDAELAIVLLSDENDCSVQLAPQNWVSLAVNSTSTMFRGSSICEQNPNDACCYACPLGAPAGCADDPVCGGGPGGLAERLADSEDGRNLRCFAQKRRFGYDFLYPTERYVNALSRPELCPERPDLALDDCTTPVANPLFASGRDPASVILGGILGVPWQIVAATSSPSGSELPDDELRFKTPSEFTTADWDELIGSPHTSPPVPPASPFMIESPFARPGIADGNAINGGEYDTSVEGVPDDLEYACVFPMPDQQSAKAYPGLRQLEVLRAHGANAALGSICARNSSDPARADFAYRPALGSVLERLEARLARPEPND